MRILHFSDVHLESGFRTDGLRPFVTNRLPNKRTIAYANLALRRRPLFKEAPHKIRMLTRWAQENHMDLVLCTGDYTALGTEQELRYARQLIEPLTHAPLGYITVPGNHDHYLADTIQGQYFEKQFAPWLTTDLPELVTHNGWPRVRLLDANPATSPPIAVITVNSARPNTAVHNSSGHIPEPQLAGLKAALAHPNIRDRFVIVATHYAPRRADGTPDKPHHCLKNADQFLDVCRAMSQGIIAHGHIHECYSLKLPEAPFWLFGAGSATHRGREGFWMYDITSDKITATPGVWSKDHYTLKTSNVSYLRNNLAHI